MSNEPNGQKMHTGGRELMVPHQVLSGGNPEELQDMKIASMADAMELAMSRGHVVDDPDPDPEGYLQELEDILGVDDLLEPEWKAKPDDKLWVKRLRGRARKQTVMHLFVQGFTPAQIAEKVKVSQPTIYNDLMRIGQEWRKMYIDDAKELAARDMARFDYYLTMLAPAIDRGDVKAIMAAVDIIKERSTIIGYRQGLQVDIEQMVREVAEANGYDPDRAVQFAQRISISMKS